MMGVKIVLAMALLVGLSSPMHAGKEPSGLCPDGFNEIFNINEPGCTFCYAPTDCQPLCLAPPACFCPPGDRECCLNNPCCEGCPGAKPFECLTGSCTCAPDTCCSTVCPPHAPAPTASSAGIGVLVAVLAGLGMTGVSLRHRWR